MKAKVTKITKMDKKDNYGNTSFVVEFENGDKGFYTSKVEDQKKFIVNQEAEYTIEKKIGSTGKEYFKISPPQSESNPFQKGKIQVDPKIQMISFAMSYTKDLVVAGKIQIADLKQHFNTIYEIMTSKL